MFAIDRVSDAAREVFLSHGASENTWQLLARFDRDDRQRAVEGYLLLADQKLYILSLPVSNHGFGERRTEKGRAVPSAAEVSLVVLPLEAVERLSVEEYVSSGRLLLIRSNGGAEPIAYFSNFCKDSIHLFVKYTLRFLRTGDCTPEEADLSDGKFCPTCGSRYPDRDRKICPHCMKRGKMLRRVLGFAARYRVSLLLMVLSLVVLTATGILAPYFSSGFYYDEVIDATGHFAGNLLLVLFLVVGAAVSKMLATMLNDFVTSVIAAKMVYDLKKTIFSSIERLSLRFFTGRQTGRLMTQINEDSNTIYEFFCDGVPYLIVHSLQSVLLMVLLFCIEPILGLISLLICTVYTALLIQWVFHGGKKLSARRFAASGRLNSFLADVFSGVRVVKAFAKEDVERERFSERNDRLAVGERKHLLFHNYSRSTVALLLAFGTATVWGLGGWMVIRGERGLTYGMLLTFVTYLGMLYSSLRSFAEKIGGGAECSNALGRLFEIMDTQPETVECRNPYRGELADGGVEFRNVTFSYQKGRRVIDNVSFRIPGGGVLGIVGHTGAGKSTLANLLLRMYEVDEGEILLGGIPIRQLSMQTLYRSVAIVSQETYLFIGSIAENIGYACPEASREEIIHAAKCAGAHEFIMSFPDGYNTKIGVGYQELSGGERQRLSIARAILKNPRVLILDEATSAMDTATERRIQEALHELIRGRTTIMIAHRLSTLRDADALLVIENGKVVEEGTHRALLEDADGIYSRLYRLQEEALKNAGISESTGEERTKWKR